jgi:hypothetical protein
MLLPKSAISSPVFRRSNLIPQIRIVKTGTGEFLQQLSTPLMPANHSCLPFLHGRAASAKM